MDTGAKRVEFTVGAEKMSFETGRMAKQAAGSVLVRTGDSVVLVACALASEVKEGQDFFPLTVDYRERTYAAGRIPGGFFKRETRPREKETLTSRLIDRSIRPLFPEGFLNAVQVTAFVVSSDQINDTDIPSINAASLAVCLSHIPFAGPIGAVRIGLLSGNFIVNPTFQQQDESDLDLIVAGSKKGILMVESGSKEVSEDQMLQALELAHKEIIKICEVQEKFVAQHGKKKIDFTAAQPDPELKKAVEAEARPKVRETIRQADKAAREDAFSAIKKDIVASFAEKFPDKKKEIAAVIENVLYEEARSMILKDKVRADGRKWDQIRNISIEVGVLPRTHGSALFTRGQTQSLATVTLGTPSDQQVMDDLEGEYKERFMLHYNFPGFSTGEAKPDRSPGRREIGHGALARRALLPLLPSLDDFPYTIRVVSDILESNGSSSQASVCGGSLALMDAGVPVKAPCAGIAMGLIVANPGQDTSEHAILSDILGMEDHLGDMDFKVAGTSKGITALQMDLKIDGIPLELMKKAVAQAHAGRLHILGKMNEVISSPRGDLSQFAPRMIIVKIPTDKIGALIGPGGKNIRRIIEETGAQVDVEDDGSVFISGTDAAGVKRAQSMVGATAAEVEVGKTYTGKVTRIMDFGAFVEVLPGKEGLVHISQLDTKRVERVEDVVKEGEELTVKCVEIDSQGRVNLSRKAVLLNDDNLENYVAVRGPRRDGGDRGRRPHRN